MAHNESGHSSTSSSSPDLCFDDANVADKLMRLEKQILVINESLTDCENKQDQSRDCIEDLQYAYEERLQQFREDFEAERQQLREDFEVERQQLRDDVEELRRSTNSTNTSTSQPVTQLANGGDTSNENPLSDAILLNRPNVSWSDIAGLEKAKMLLRSNVITPVTHPRLFTGNLKPAKSILLFGPSGTGKTYLAKAVNTEASNSAFFSISPSNIMSKWLGQSEKNIMELFAMARNRKPSIIFIDNVDWLGVAQLDESTCRIKWEFLRQMDGVRNDDDAGVVVIAATSTPWVLDEAFLRRFQKRIHVPMPEWQDRLSMLKMYTAENPHTLTDEDLEELATDTDGYSCHDVATVVEEALTQPIYKIDMATHFRPATVDSLTPRADNRQTAPKNPAKKKIDEEKGLFSKLGQLLKLGCKKENHDHGFKSQEIIEVREPSHEDQATIEQPTLQSQCNSWTPCDPSDPQAKKMSLNDLAKDSIVLPPLSMEDMRRALSHIMPTVDEDTLEKLDEFDQKFCLLRY